MSSSAWIKPQSPSVKTGRLGPTSQSKKYRAEIHRLREELMENQKKLQLLAQVHPMARLAGGLVHEFRNLLEAMDLQVAMIVKTKAEDAELLEDLELLKTAIRQGSQLCKRVLNFYTQHNDNRVGVCLNSVVKNVMAVASRTILLHMEVEIQLNKKLPLTGLTEGELTQILWVLLTNARDAMDAKARLIGRDFQPKRVVITTGLAPFVSRDQSGGDFPGEGSKPWHFLSVEDTGIGMNDQTRKRCVEPFYSTKQDQGGVGLGLSSVSDILCLRRGILEVASTPGKGSRLLIYLPAQ
jgi:two-component system cell cycle sensor histidine kinase/response regulator CckA